MMFAIEGINELGKTFEASGAGLRHLAARYFKVVHSPQYRQVATVVLAPSSFVYFQF
jgi:hypothetical protein